jgi:thiamine-phosphate pyrophosphorylase
MPNRIQVKTRLCLVAPDAPGPDFVGRLDEALRGGGEVASLIVAAPLSRELLTRFASVAARHGTAMIAAPDDAAIPGVDGVHVDAGIAALRAAITAHRPKRMVGAGGIHSRHDAMTLGEAEPDYLFVGRLDGDTEPGIHGPTLELASWWAELFEIPAIVMGGSDLASVAEAADAGIEFVALRRVVWEHPEGPAAAIAEAIRFLAAPAEAAR